MRKENLNRFNDYKKIDKSNGEYLVYDPLIRDLNYSIKKYATGDVLDIGCGNKPYEELFKHCKKYVGCDAVQSSLYKVDIICNANNIQIEESNIFDTVFCTQVVEHVEDYDGMLKEAYRLLKKNGFIIISGPMSWYIHEAPYDFYRFTKYGFHHILSKAGFEVIEILPNGGKWAFLGQVIIHVFPQWVTKRRIFRRLINLVFSKLDKKYHDDKYTLNYVAVAKKQ